MISANIDLSVSMVSFKRCDVLHHAKKADLDFLSHSAHFPVEVFMGFINGLLVMKWRIVPVIATLVATYHISWGLPG